ncbi:MAG: sensor histidine kinase, partial [Myxococcota bacterium]
MLALPTGFLAERALRGVAAERELRHRAVAERAFDEMERALSGLLRDEEERPALQYIAFAALPPPAFVLGHFELELDGNAHTDVAEPERAGRVLAAARAIGADSGARNAKEDQAALDAKRERQEVAQAPGTTAWLGGLARADAPRDASAPAAAPPAPAYDALQKLNRGVQERRVRAQKQVMQQSASAHEELAAPGEFAESVASLRDFAGSASAEAKAPEAAPAPIPARLAIDPLVGRLLPDGQLLLVRVVWSGPRVVRQGVVLDVAGLGAWLRSGALAGALPDATLSVLPAEVGATTNAAAFRYRHRFAEPFDALAGELTLAPLPDAPGAASVPWLVALGVGALALGLFAAWRTIATQLHFAERRSDFVASVSHELKTPLTAIRMYAEMLRDGMVPSEEKRKSYLGSITAEAERLSRLIGNVLEFSRLERGARKSEPRSADPTPLLREAAA